MVTWPSCSARSMRKTVAEIDKSKLKSWTEYVCCCRADNGYIFQVDFITALKVRYRFVSVSLRLFKLSNRIRSIVGWL
jgi:peptide methionine sulfoxide reductase MsrB